MLITSIRESRPLVVFLTLINSFLLLTSSDKISVLVIFFACLLSLNFVVSSKDKIRIMVFFLIGTIVATGFYHYWITFYENSYFLGKKSDDWQYDVYWTENFIERYGLNLTKLPDHLNNIESSLGILHNSKGYVSLVILFRWIASFLDGYHTMMPRIFNIYILALIAYFSSKISYFYSSSTKVKRITQSVVFFFPVMLFNSVYVFRDTIVSLILVLIYYLLVTRRFALRSIIWVMILMFILYFFRTSTFFVALLVIFMLYLNPQKIRARLVIAGILFSLIALYVLQDILLNLSRQLTEYEKLNTERFGGIGSRIFGLPLYLGAIPRIIYMIFTPVPNFSGFHQIYVSISAFIQVFTFPFLYFGLRNTKIDLKLKLTFLLFFLGIAMSTATFRHVMMYLPFGIIITVMSINFRKLERDLYRGYFNILLILCLMFILSVGLALTY